MKNVILMLADGFEEVEALTVKDILVRGGAHCVLCSIDSIEFVKGCHGVNIKADASIDDIHIDDFEGIVMPGGMPGSENLRDSKKVIDLVREFNEHGKIVAAICAAPIVLDKADIIKGKNVTSYPGFENELKGCNYKKEAVVQDENLITSRGPATAMMFAYTILENLVGKEKTEEVKKGMLYEG